MTGRKSLLGKERNKLLKFVQKTYEISYLVAWYKKIFPPLISNTFLSTDSVTQQNPESTLETRDAFEPPFFRTRTEPNFQMLNLSRTELQGLNIERTKLFSKSQTH